METKLRDLLDKIYELEGLVHLSLKREDALDDFLRLISRKGIEVGDLCKELTAKSEEINEIKEDEKVPPVQSAFDLDEYSIEEAGEEEQSNVVLEYEALEEDEQETEDNKGEVLVASERGKLVFSINERFRYKKELFDNSDLDFNNSLALVASMEDYEEAEDYFLNEEGLDRNNPVVTEFLEVIKRYFK